MSDVLTQSSAQSFAAPPWVGTLQKRALGLGLIGVIVSAIGAFMMPDQFFRSYLVGYLFWFGVGMGGLGLALLNHLTGGSWGIVARRVFEASSRTYPLLLLLFVPVILGMKELYSWARPEVMAASEILQAKEPYLNVNFFMLRAALYFAIWGFFMVLVNRWSLKQDESGDVRLPRKLAGLGAAGVLLYIMSATFAVFDWLMSVDPGWFSSIYGFYFAVTHAISAMCFTILVATRLSRTAPMEGVISKRHFDDWGKLLFAFNMLWIYISFSQFLIIWSGNLPEEIGWYVARRSNGYWEWSLVMFILHFFIPFFLLLSRGLRSNPGFVGFIAGMLLLATWMDLYWQAMPTLESELAPHWLDLAIVLGIGGLWVSAFANQLKKRALLPVNDPNLEGAIGHGHA